mmetsp:Transcript_21858/g.35397  ORF Transcript_21858/g.35397 Transcript_21858/m.35397 type:complete len:291 (+) Transcript_21858:7747-8619(+)
MKVRGVVGHVAEVDGHEPLLPLARGRMQIAVQLVARHSLGVDGHCAALLAEFILRVKESAPHRGLPAPCGAEKEHRPAHAKDFSELGDLQHEGVLGLVPQLHRRFLDRILERHVAQTWHQVQHLGEQIVEKSHEDAVVVGGELAEVEVAERLEEDLILGEVRLVALHPPCHVQRRLDGAELPVVVRRRRQKVLAQRVEDDKLARQELGHEEPLTHEHVLADELQVRHAHGHRAEERLERLRKLGASGVTRVHGDESHGRRAERDLYILEHEARLLGANGVEHSFVLGGTH